MSKATTAITSLPLGSQVSDCLVVDGGKSSVRPIDVLSDLTPGTNRFIAAQTCLVRDTPNPRAGARAARGTRQPDPRTPQADLTLVRMPCVAG